MASREPIDPRVRLAVSQWPDDAPGGAVSTSCAEHAISGKSFYELRKRARLGGPAAVLGTIGIDTVSYKADVDHAFRAVLVVSDGDQPGDKIVIADLEGEILPSTPGPLPASATSATADPRGRRPRSPRASPKS